MLIRMWKIIVYIISAAVSVIEAAVMSAYMFKSGLFSNKKNKSVVSIIESDFQIPDLKESKNNSEESGNESQSSEEETEEINKKSLCAGTDLITNKPVFPYTNLQMKMIISVSFLICFVLSVLSYNNTDYYCNYAKLMITYLVVNTAAITDLKKHIIPNMLILSGLICRIILYVIEFFSRNSDELKAIFVNDLIGVGIGFGVLFFVALLVKNSLGFGDVKLYGVIGIMTGTICTYATLIISLLSCCIFSVIMLASGKKNRKSLMSFAPFIFLGFTAAAVLGLY